VIRSRWDATAVLQLAAEKASRAQLICERRDVQVAMRTVSRPRNFAQVRTLGRSSYRNEAGCSKLFGLSLAAVFASVLA
jgi:hypothetical protein